MTNPRTRRHLRTKEAILEAALEIVNEQGPAGLSMRALADRIDYSPAGLYEYFGSKDEIIAAICQQGEEHLAAYMNAVNRNLPLEAYMLGIGKAYIRFALRYPDHFLLMMTRPSPREMTSESLSQALEEGSSFGILGQAIQRGIAEGIYPDRPGYGWLEKAYAAWGMVHGIAMLRITGLRNFEYEFENADHCALLAVHRGLMAV